MVVFYSSVGSRCLHKMNPLPDADDGSRDCARLRKNKRGGVKSSAGRDALLPVRCVFDALSRAFHILACSVNGVAGGHDEDREKCEESGDEYLLFNFVHNGFRRMTAKCLPSLPPGHYAAVCPFEMGSFPTRLISLRYHFF
jgi:hypothetical protein